MKKFIATFLLFIPAMQIVFAQSPVKDPPFKVDSVHIVDPSPRTKLFPSMIVPAVLIGWGISTIGNHGIYSSHEARTDVLRLTAGKGSHIDDYLQFSPYAEFAALILLRQKCKNDAINTALLILKSEIIMEAIVYPTKILAHEERPDSYGRRIGANTPEKQADYIYQRDHDKQTFLSMPSGHTANAFVAATIVFREYRYKSVWYGVGAYALATSVAAFRMINDKHWESDVFVGAGVGMLATNIVYATHLHRWGRKEVCFVPTYTGTYTGFVMNAEF
jgi:membrane-associated phospholipid phosphatase